MRRVLLLALVLAVLGLPTAAAHAASRDASRATASFSAMERYLYDRRLGDYRERVGIAPGSDAWPFSQALAANIAIARLPGLAGQAPVRARFATLERRFRSASA